MHRLSTMAFSLGMLLLVGPAKAEPNGGTAVPEGQAPRAHASPAPQLSLSAGAGLHTPVGNYWGGALGDFKLVWHATPYLRPFAFVLAEIDDEPMMEVADAGDDDPFFACGVGAEIHSLPEKFVDPYIGVSLGAVHREKLDAMAAANVGIDFGAGYIHAGPSLGVTVAPEDRGDSFGPMGFSLMGRLRLSF